MSKNEKSINVIVVTIVIFWLEYFIFQNDGEKVRHIAFIRVLRQLSQRQKSCFRLVCYFTINPHVSLSLFFFPLYNKQQKLKGKKKKTRRFVWLPTPPDVCQETILVVSLVLSYFVS